MTEEQKELLLKSPWAEQVRHPVIFNIVNVMLTFGLLVMLGVL